MLGAPPSGDDFNVSPAAEFGLLRHWSATITSCQSNVFSTFTQSTIVCFPLYLWHVPQLTKRHQRATTPCNRWTGCRMNHSLLVRHKFTGRNITSRFPAGNLMRMNNGRNLYVTAHTRQRRLTVIRKQIQ